MFRPRNRLLFFILFPIIIIILGISSIPVIYSISDSLAKSKRVNAQILVVEGWLPTYAIKMAYDEFMSKEYSYIVTTGIKNTSDYFNLYSNGSLVFHNIEKKNLLSAYGIHTIDIKAFSSLGGENSAIFNVLINDSIINTFTADRKKRDYLIKWDGSLSNIDSISVRFLNDKNGDLRDRNLFVKEIILDQKISIPYQRNSVYYVDRGNRGYRINNNYDSYASLAKDKLLAMGIDSSLIIDIPGKKVAINRTLTSALAFREWLQASDLNIQGINVVTLGTHAKRTRMIYNRILRDNYEVGIISLPDNREKRSRRYRILKTLRELLGITYYWFVLIPY